MAPFTQSKKEEAIAHILSTVFGLQDDSILHKAFKHTAILDPYDIVTMHDVDMETFKYPDTSGTSLPLCWKIK